MASTLPTKWDPFPPCKSPQPDESNGFLIGRPQLLRVGVEQRPKGLGFSKESVYMALVEQLDQNV